MKINKITQKNTELYIKILFITLNLLVLIYLYFFLRDNAYQAIIPDKDYIISESMQSTGDVNTDKLNRVIDNFEKKSKTQKKESLEKNPFVQ